MLSPLSPRSSALRLVATTNTSVLYLARHAAANDSAAHRAPRTNVANLNILVASTVAHVSALLQPARVNIELHLAPSRPMAQGNPTEVGFTVGGIVSAQMRGLEGADGGRLRVETRSNGPSVSVFIASDEVPPLGMIRAVTAREKTPGEARDIDPTVAHCRRLIEALGGSIALSQEHGLLGFALVFPTVLFSQTTPLAAVRTTRESRRAA